MKPQLSLVTLGVSDITAARAFYERLGFRASRDSNDDVVFFDAGGVILALFGRKSLADDATVQDAPTGFAAIALARNVASEQDVDAALATAAAAGARIVKPAHKTFWGGYSGYFADPDGHLWEVAHNPFWPLDSDGRPQLPPPA